MTLLKWKATRYVHLSAIKASHQVLIHLLQDARWTNDSFTLKKH